MAVCPSSVLSLTGSLIVLCIYQLLASRRASGPRSGRGREGGRGTYMLKAFVIYDSAKVYGLSFALACELLLSLLTCSRSTDAVTRLVVLTSFPYPYSNYSTERRVVYHRPYFKKPIFKSFFFLPHFSHSQIKKRRERVLYKSFLRN